MRQIGHIGIQSHAVYYLPTQINNCYQNKGNRDAAAFEACKRRQHYKGKHYTAGPHQMDICVEQCRGNPCHQAGQKNKFTNKFVNMFLGITLL